VSVLYADTSALVRAYLADEPDHAELAELLLSSDRAVVTSELTRLELASAVHSAARARRLSRPQVVLDRFDADCGEDGPLVLLRFDPALVLARAHGLIGRFPVRTLDALHLAVALTGAAELAAGEPVVLVSRDSAQQKAAAALGLGNC